MTLGKRKKSTATKRSTSVTGRVCSGRRNSVTEKRLSEMIKRLIRSFPISEEESIAVRNWIFAHEERRHKARNTIIKSKAYGNRYTYCFVPTEKWVLGTIKCRCGAECTFRSL